MNGGCGDRHMNSKIFLQLLRQVTFQTPLVCHPRQKPRASKATKTLSGSTHTIHILGTFDIPGLVAGREDTKGYQMQGLETSYSSSQQVHLTWAVGRQVETPLRTGSRNELTPHHACHAPEVQ